MATLLNNAHADGFGAAVAVTSSFASVQVIGLRENSPTRVVLHWSPLGVTYQPLVDTLQWNRTYPVDLPAGSGYVKAETLGTNPSDSISATITFG